MSMTDVRRAGLYVRLSRDRPDEVSTTVQERQARQLCEQRGWQPVEVYSDVGISGFTGADRPAYERMLADLRAGAIDAVVVFKLDRVARQLRAFVDLTELLDAHGAVFASVHDPIDTSTPIGRAVLNVLAVFAQLESEQLSLRLQAANAERAERGQPHRGGRRPFGWAADRKTPVPGEQQLLVEAVDRFLDDADSLRGICADWNRRGIVTPTGGQWSFSALSAVLRSPRLAGYRRHKGDLYDAVWDSVIPRDRWEQLQAALADSRRRSRRKSVERYLLTGIATCGLCETPMMSFGSDGRSGKPRYTCRKDQGLKGCGSVSILQEPTDELVGEMLLSVFDVDRARAALSGRDDAERRRQLHDELRATEQGLAQLAADFYVDNVIGRAEWLAAREPLTVRLEQLRRRVDALPEPTGVTIADDVDLDEWWHADTTPLEHRRQLLRAAVHRVVIKPARRRGYNRYDPDRVDPLWRV